MASPLGALPVKQLLPQFAALGMTTPDSAISRLEHGKGVVSTNTVYLYEQLLELPYGTLQGALWALARCVDRDVQRQLVTDPTPRTDAEQIVEQILTADEEGGDISASQWLRLARAVCPPSEHPVPIRLLRRWVHRLISELMRGVNHGYFARLEAASMFAAYDRTARLVLNSVQELTRLPGVDGACEAWAVVGDMRDPALFQAIIAPLASTPEGTFRLYLTALAQPVADGSLSAPQLASIADACTHRVASVSPGTLESIARVASTLPPRLGNPILAEIDRTAPRSRITGYRDGRDVTDELEVYSRVATEQAWPGRPDEMLTELLRVVLLGENHGQRVHVGSLLWLSPYASSLTQAAVAIARSDDFAPSARDAAVWVMMRTATTHDHELLHLLLGEQERVDIRHAALVGLAHTGGLTDLDLRPYLDEPRLRAVAIYALGITQHPQLFSLDLDSDEVRWWRATGGGFFE